MSNPVNGNEIKWFIFEEKYISCLKRFRWMHKIYKFKKIKQSREQINSKHLQYTKSFDTIQNYVILWH